MKKQMKNIVIVIGMLVLAFVIVKGINVYKDVKEFEVYEEKINAYQIYYTSVCVGYKEKPQDIFMKLCEEYPDTCHYKTSDWLFLVEFTNRCNLDDVKPGDYLIVPYLNGSVQEF